MKKTLLNIMALAVMLSTTGHTIQNIQIKLFNEEEPPLLGSSIDIHINPLNEEEPPLF